MCMVRIYYTYGEVWLIINVVKSHACYADPFDIVIEYPQCGVFWI